MITESNCMVLQPGSIYEVNGYPLIYRGTVLLDTQICLWLQNIKGEDVFRISPKVDFDYPDNGCVDY